MGAYDAGKIGPVDRTVRAIVGVALVLIALRWVSVAALQIALWALGGVLVLEGLFGWCPRTFLRNRAAAKAPPGSTSQPQPGK